MKISNITESWLKEQNYQIKKPNQLTIKGAHVKDLTTHLDGRGEVTELWSEGWSEKWLIRPNHIYQSATDYGVVKGWHLHQDHTDQHTVTRGKIQISLVDVRENSPTFGEANSIIIGSLRPKILSIPPGVMHGWKALSFPEVIVVNLQSHVYDPNDEYKFTWDCILKDIWEPKNG